MRSESFLGTGNREIEAQCSIFVFVVRRIELSKALVWQPVWMLSPKSFSGCEPGLNASPRGLSVNFSENEAGTFLNSIPRTLVLAKNLSGVKGGWGLGSKASGWSSPPHLTAEASGAALGQCLKEQPRLRAAACCMLGGSSASPARPLHVPCTSGVELEPLSAGAWLALQTLSSLSLV